MTTAYAPAPEYAQADVSPDAPLPLDEIRTLVDERGRYEGWLQALDARRGATPDRVLARVREDYAGRLDRVASQLAAHAGPLRAHEAALGRQHAAVEQRLGDERDVLAEVELRTLVGEYAPDAGEQRRAAAQQAIDALERELGGAAAQLADVRALAARVVPAEPATARSTPAQPAPAAPPAVTPTPAPQGVAANAPANAPVSVQEPVGTEVDPADVAPNAPMVEPPQTGTREGAASEQGGVDYGTFDHGAVDAARVALGDREPSLTPSFSEAVRGGVPNAFGFGGGRPPAAEPVAAGQEKTLRCQECGALNYPTEWYCEKCGGELAAL